MTKGNLIPELYFAVNLMFNSKDYLQSSNVINDTLMEYLEKAAPYKIHFHNPFSFTKQYICRHIYGLIYI